MNESVETSFATSNITKLILKFGIPCATSMVVQALYNIVDQIFIGQSVGYLGNAATNVSFGIVVLAMAFAIFIGDGSAAYFSLMLGRGNKEKAEKAIGNCVTLLCLCTAIFMLIGFPFMKPLLKMFGATDEVMPYASVYTKIILMGLPASIFGAGLNSIIRADGSPNFAMVTMLSGAVANIILDPIFIFKFNMGVAGAAIATIIGQYISLVLGLYYITRCKNVKLKGSSFVPDKQASFRICTLGVSSFITQMSLVVVISVVNNCLVKYGANSIYGSEIPLAALGIVMKVNSILISLLLGISLGSQPIIGYNYGAQEYARVKEAFKVTATIATACAAVAFVAFMFFPQYIILIFGQESPLYMEFAVKCFRLHLPCCIFNGFYFTSTILFQAIGQPVKSTTLSLTRQIIFIVPLTLALAVIMGLDGVLLGGAVADFLAFIVAFSLVLKEMKELNRLNLETQNKKTGAEPVAEV
ncbi:MAG: MATE family efflux transporter [Clostridia bacterium]|nr:MATE family efflux transporter [Clostridia bacterium]